MAMAHHSASFPLFSSLPAELRMQIFEHALLPLIEPRIVAVYKDINDPDCRCNQPFGNFFSLFVVNRSFLRASDPFIASAATIRQVCTESRDVVQSFHSRWGLPGPQPAFESRRLNGLSLGTPLRPQGPHSDLFLDNNFTLLEDKEFPFSGPANKDVGHVKRWLVPVRDLLRDLRVMSIFRSSIRRPFLESQHDIIALVSNPGDPDALKYSHLIIVSADASGVIPGLDDDDRDSIVDKFEQIKEIFERVERRRLERNKEPIGVSPRRVGPNLYFAYVNPLKRVEPPQLTQM